MEPSHLDLKRYRFGKIYRNPKNYRDISQDPTVEDPTRSITLRCQECDRPARGKPYCRKHIHLMPYIQKIMNMVRLIPGGR